jgi:ribosomal protein L20
MGVLDKLKIVALAKQVKGTVEQERRKKLAGQLTEQLKLAEAALGGVAYQRTKAAWETDAEGHRHRVQRTVKLRQWWTVVNGGAVQFGVRYGAVPLQLQPGKTAVEVAKLADLSNNNAQRHHALRTHLQNLHIRARSVHPRPDPPGAGTDHVDIL